MKFRQKFRVFQIVSYQLNYVSKDLPFHLLAVWNHMEQFGTIFEKYRSEYLIHRYVKTIWNHF